MLSLLTLEKQCDLWCCAIVRFIDIIVYHYINLLLQSSTVISLSKIGLSYVGSARGTLDL